MSKIVVIDDDHQYAELLRRLLSAAGHQVLCCGSLREGQEAVASFAPEIVLLDVCLPDGSGLERIHAIKAARCLPEVVVITASGDEDGAELAIRAGVWGYWLKSRPIRELQVTIAQALAYREERMARRDWRALDVGGLIGESQAMVACFEAIAEAAAGDVPVLIRGETGTGKEMVAKAIHGNSARAAKPFVVVDCASLTETLLESSLFGHDKGAFTGASTDRVGLVRQAHQGTLFLDEIGELTASGQKAFLRVLQEKRFRPVGSDREASSDFRLLAATHRDLRQMVVEGRFREDLYFRLRSMEVDLPPLRARGGDITRIAAEVASQACVRSGAPGKRLSAQLAEALADYPWPGNVRELRQAMECAVVSAGSATTLEPIHLPVQIRVHLARAAVKPELRRAPLPSEAGRPTLAAVRDAASAAYLSQLLDEVNGDIEAACGIAEVSRSKLYGLLKTYGIGRAGQTRTPEPNLHISCVAS